MVRHRVFALRGSAPVDGGFIRDNVALSAPLEAGDFAKKDVLLINAIFRGKILETIAGANLEAFLSSI